MCVTASEVRYGVTLRPLFLVDDGREWDDNDDMDSLEDYLTTKRAEEMAAGLGHYVTRRSIARAARRWYEDKSETGIVGCVKLGDIDGTGGWMIPKQSFLNWLEARKPRGPKPSQERD